MATAQIQEKVAPKPKYYRPDESLMEIASSAKDGKAVAFEIPAMMTLVKTDVRKDNDGNVRKTRDGHEMTERFLITISLNSFVRNEKVYDTWQEVTGKVLGELGIYANGTEEVFFYEKMSIFINRPFVPKKA